MADDYIVGIGTVGAGLWLGYAAGQKWRHVQHGPSIEGNCRALAVDVRHPGTMWAGADRLCPSRVNLVRRNVRVTEHLKQRQNLSRVRQSPRTPRQVVGAAARLR